MIYDQLRSELTQPLPIVRPAPTPRELATRVEHVEIDQITHVYRVLDRLDSMEGKIMSALDALASVVQRAGDAITALAEERRQVASLVGDLEGKLAQLDPPTAEDAAAEPAAAADGQAVEFPPLGS